MKNRPVNVIFNPVAGGGKGRRLISDILSMMKNRFDSEVLLWETQRSGDAAMFARGIVLSDNDLIIIVGGDGTINETVNGLIENGRCLKPECRLGIIDCGTGSGLSKSLGLPAPIASQIDLIARGSSSRIDLAKVIAQDSAGEGTVVRLFASEAQVGIGADVARKVEQSAKWLGGKWVFGSISFKEAIMYRARSIEVALDGKNGKKDRFIGIAAGNGRFTAGGMRLTPDAVLHDGLLDVLFIHDMHTIKRLNRFPKIYSGSHIDCPEFTSKRCKRLSVFSQESIPVSADGEVIGKLPCSIEVIPSVLRVICPE